MSDEQGASAGLAHEAAESLSVGAIAKWALDHQKDPAHRGCGVNCGHSTQLIRKQVGAVIEMLGGQTVAGSTLGAVRIHFVLSKIGERLSQADWAIE